LRLSLYLIKIKVFPS